MQGDLVTLQFAEKFHGSVSTAFAVAGVKLIEETRFTKHNVPFVQWAVVGEVFPLYTFFYQLGKYRVPGIEFTTVEHNIIF